MNAEYPLFPELPEAGQEEAQKLIQRFKEELKKAADKAIGDLYCDVAVHIESDSWTNYRNKLMDGFRNYGNRKIQGEHEFKEIRQQIYKEFRDEIIQDLNQDLLEEVKQLKNTIKIMQDSRP